MAAYHAKMVAREKQHSNDWHTVGKSVIKAVKAAHQKILRGEKKQVPRKVKAKKPCKQGHFFSYHSAKIKAPICHGTRKPSARFVKRPGRANYYLNASQLTKYGVARGQKKSHWEKQKAKKAARKRKV